MDKKRNISISVALTIVIFILDVLTLREYSAWALYIIPLLFAAPGVTRPYIPLFPLGGTILIVLDFFLSPGEISHLAIINRSLGIVTLWAALPLLIRQKKAEEELARSYRELERRVEDRTSELNQVNASLKAEVAERKRVEETLRDSEERYRAFAYAGSSAVWRSSGDGTALLQLIGPGFAHEYSEPEKQRGDWLNYIHPEDRNRTLETWKRAVASRSLYEIEHRNLHSDGTYHYYFSRGVPIISPEGEVREWIGSSIDITGRKRAEEALRESEAAYRLLFETMIPGVFYQDAEGRIVSMNPAAARILGKTPEEFLGETSVSIEHHSIREDGTPFPGLQHPSMTALRTGREVRNVVMGVYNPREKAYRWININAVPLFRGGEGSPYQVYTIFDDITERKQTEDSLKKTMQELARSNTDLEQFAYAVSHDLQEPLRTMEGYLDLLADRYKGRLDEKAGKYILSTIDGASRMSTLINDLLAYSRIGTRGRQFAPVEMSSVYKKAAENLKRAVEEGHAVITSDALPHVSGDESQLVQLLQNLIGNAVKFRKKDVQPRIHLSAERKGAEWVFGVRDNGIGIEPRYYDRIFAVFQRLHTRQEYAGTGIGLAICRRIAERHRGRIWVESKPGGRIDLLFHAAGRQLKNLFIFWSTRHRGSRGWAGNTMYKKRNITIAIVLTIVIFVINVRTPLGYADWVLYVVPLLIADPAVTRSFIVLFPLTDTILIILDSFLSPSGGIPAIAACNRAIGIFTIWTVSFLIVGRKQAEEALEQSYRELEQRVEDRTAELRRINASLQDEIAERRKAEEALRQAGRRVTEILESISDAFFALDDSLVVTYFNRAAELLLRRKSEDVVGRKLFEAFPEAKGAVFEEQYTRAAREKVALAFETFFGEKPYENWYDVRVYPQENGISVYFQVITERKRTEESLKKSMEEVERSNRELEHFAYAVSHDLQEPLRTVAGFVGLLGQKYKGKLDDKADKYISHAIGGVSRMSTLIDGLLLYSRAGTGGRQFEEVDMGQVFETASENLKRTLEENHAVLTRNDLPAVFGDKTQLVQLLQNLIANAVKFRKKDVLPRIHISAERQGAEWVFRVHDNGIGIKPEFHERIFGIFQRLHTREEYPGSGVGLAICRRIVERHGGRVWLESKPGEGSTFFFSVPGRG